MIEVASGQSALRCPARDDTGSERKYRTTSRGFGAFFERWDIILTPITALPTPKVWHHRISDDQRQSIGAGTQFWTEARRERDERQPRQDVNSQIRRRWRTSALVRITDLGRASREVWKCPIGGHPGLPATPQS